MAYGIWSQPVGPGPAAPAPLFIDANLTFPQSVSSFTQRFPFNRNQSSTVSFSGWDGQGVAFALPTWNMVFTNWPSTQLYPDIYGVTSYGITSSSTLQVNMNTRIFQDWIEMSFNVYKLWPQSDRNYGVTFSNSADFMSISDSGVVSQCIWAWQGDLSGSLTIPAIPGYDMNRVVVFANWNSSTAGLNYFAGDRRVQVYENHSNFSYNNTGGSVGWARICVFANGVGVPTHNGGFNIYSPNGQQCVFSTYNTPFNLSGWVASGGGNTGLTYPMIPLGSSLGGIQQNAGGFYYQHQRSHMMTGSSVGTGFGASVAQWTNRYAGGYDGVLNVSVPVLDASKYFAGL